MNKFSDDEFSVYVGNLDCRIPLADLEELLYELFLQVRTLRGLVVVWPCDPLPPKLHAVWLSRW